MSKTFQVGAGNKVKLFVALLPLGDRTPPEDVTVTAASGINSNETGVYIIRCTVNDFIYIGSAASKRGFRGRLIYHIWQLKAGSPTCN